MTKIGFFQKWNQEAGQVEWSMTRLKVAALTVTVILFVAIYFCLLDNPVTYESVILIATLLGAGVATKNLTDKNDKMLKK